MPRAAAKARVREARQAMYRELVLEAGERAFAEHGYDATRMQQIAEEAGVSLATIYAVFPGKSELWRAVHERRGRELLEVSSRQLDLAKASAVDLLLGGTAASARFHMAHPTYLRMSLRQGHAWAVGTGLRTGEELDTWERGVAMLEAVFARGAADGHFRTEDPPALMARALMALHQVRLAAWADGGADADEDATVIAMQRQLLRVFCRPDVAESRLAELDDLESQS